MDVAERNWEERKKEKLQLKCKINKFILKRRKKKSQEMVPSALISVIQQRPFLLKHCEGDQE